MLVFSVYIPLLISRVRPVHSFFEKESILENPSQIFTNFFFHAYLSSMPLSGSHMQKYIFSAYNHKKATQCHFQHARLRRYINVNQLKFRNCKTLVNQSFLSESTGFEVAASQLRSVTISIVIASTVTRDNANTHQ